MSNATNITYGSYDFQVEAGPVPFLTINKEFKRLADGTQIGSVYRVTLNGQLNMVPQGNTGYKNLDDMQDALCSGFMTDCEEFKVVCGADILIQEYPRVNSITFTPTKDNWTQSTDFVIELEWEGESYNGLYLDTISESWDLQLSNDANYYNWALAGGTGDNNMHLFSLSHDVSAKGIKVCNGGREAWVEARDWVVSRLGYATGQVEGSGVFNLNTASFSGWNHSRVQRIDEQDGHFHVSETWMVADTGFQNNAGAAIEDFTASVSYDVQNGLTSIAVNGSIQGLEEVSYGTNPGDYTVVRDKYSMASGFWENVRPKLSGRAALVSNVSVNPSPLNYNIGHNPTKGTITYNYQFDDRPCNFISNALFENITITDENPTDVFAEIAILGRAFGPVLQNLDTVTSSKRTVNIDLIMGPVTGCVDITNSITKPDVSSLLCALQTDLSGTNTQLFKNQDSESWNFKTGRYTRNVTWTYVDCSGAAPVTSFC